MICRAKAAQLESRSRSTQDVTIEPIRIENQLAMVCSKPADSSEVSFGI
jgi:hypothetical protein